LEASRRKNFYTNISVGMIQRGVTLVTSFVNRTVFIYTLGMAYLGVGGLFTDILTIFSLAELGIGSAITYHLYKPLAENNKEKIKSLMHFYKVCYRVIGVVILIVGLCIVPFLDYLITDTDNAIQINIEIVYLLYLTNTVTSYLFFAYKTTLLSAAQKVYKSQLIDIAYSVVSTIIFSIVLLYYRDFIVYLVVKIGCDIIKNVIISKEIDRVFPLLKEKAYQKFSKDEIKQISENIYAVFVGKISGTIFTSTDSIIISRYIGTILVGISDNYRMIIRNIISLGGIFTGALLPAVGDMAARQSRQECQKRFTNYNFLCFWIYSLIAICMAHTFNSFIIPWIGEENTFAQITVLVLVLNFWLDLILQIVYSFRAAYGLYKYGEYIQLIGAVCNIFLSIKLIPIMGITGVFFATTITNLPTFLYPFYLFKYGFQSSSLEYYKKLLGQVGALFIAYIVSGYCCKVIVIGGYLEFILKGLVCVLITNLIFFFLYFKTDEFRFIKKEILVLYNKVLRRG